MCSKITMTERLDTEQRETAWQTFNAAMQQADAHTAERTAGISDGDKLNEQLRLVKKYGVHQGN
jgi:hypothetical protein